MPILTIFAGCNGAGKSTFAQNFLPNNEVCFNTDIEKAKIFEEVKSYGEQAEEIASRQANELFNSSADESIRLARNFSFECNFLDLPIDSDLQKFINAGYTTNIVFFCLKDRAQARDRVNERVFNGGHFIDEESLKNRWKMGYASLDAHHKLFDNIIIIDNSNDNKIYKPILNYSKSQLIYKIEILPNYFQKRLPRLYLAIERLQSKVPKRIRRL